MKNVKNILFDFGNVLLDIDLTRIETNLKPLFGSHFEAARTFFQKENLFELLETGGISTDEFLEKSSSCSPVFVEKQAVVAAWNSIFIGMSARRFEMLLRLRRHGGLFMLSNINPIHEAWIDEYIRREHGFGDWQARFFDNVYYSHLIRLRKPTSEAFEYVVADAEIEPRETLFIDDLPENIEAARQLGFQTRLHPVGSEIADWADEFLM